MSQAYPGKRAHERLPITLEVNYRTRMELLSADTENVSAGGMFIRTMYPLPEGTELNIQFAIPEESIEFSVTGKIVWAVSMEESQDESESGMGIKFVNMSREKLKILQDYISSQLAGR